MDFLDPKKERLNRIVLFVSYGLVSLAIAIASVVLLYQTDGYCVDGKGAVDRCGLVFVSSQPNGANLYIDGKLKKTRTNTKLNLQSGSYALRVSRDGYRDWRRDVAVLGGDVQRFDYPFLFPVSLKTTGVTTFTNPVVLASQSPDRRWLLVAEDGQNSTFHLYDVKNADKTPISTVVTLPAGLTNSGDGGQTWKAIEWSTNNRHVLLQHGYSLAGVQGQEYILLDRQTSTASRNLTKDLSLVPADVLSLFDKKPTQFYVYNSEAKTLRTAAVSGGAPTTLQLARVLAYKTYADDTLLYVTDTPPSGKAIPGKVSVVLQQANQVRVLRHTPATASTFLLDIAQYDGDWYVAVGADSEKGVQIYRNPLEEILSTASAVPSAIRFLKVSNPTYVAFSANTQYILAENGQQIAVYDTEYGQTYSYSLPVSLDSPQSHVQWMDGNRILYVSDGKAQVSDYDNTNMQTLQAALPAWSTFFTPDYTAAFTLQPVSATGSTRLAKTLLTVQ